MAHVDDILEAARDKNHPLHDCFEWDDDVAGQEHRRWQCRQLLSKVRYLHTTVTGEIVRVVGYVHDVAQNEGYVPIDAVQPNSEQARNQLLHELYRIETLVTRALNLAEVWEMEAEFNGLMEHVQGVIQLLHKRPVKRKHAPKAAKRKVGVAV